MSKMAKILVLDAAAAIVAFAAAVVSISRIADWPRLVFMAMFGVVFVVCVVRIGRGRKARGLAKEDDGVWIVELLDEESRSVFAWNLSGASAVIGKSNAERTVDIDLSNSAFASDVKDIHAVLNFAAGNWYIEDAGTNGSVSIEREDSVYRLAEGEFCIPAPGDVIRIAGARLMFTKRGF
jgi:hypothetical protein